ncbi:MAG TPA: hypothetical protein VFZ25_21130 [Chloroflexota bacterium]|nr:hypothetical protein [Chloroflexota bacterium]
MTNRQHPLVITLAGAGSASGRAKEVFRPALTYLQVAGGYTPEDFAEASYRIEGDGAPLTFSASDSTLPLTELVNRVAQNLHWFRLHTNRPIDLLGWSLGGVVFFDALLQLVEEDPSWEQSISSLVAVSSPLLGSDLDGIHLLGQAAAGPVGADLARRAADALQKRAVRDGAARLREAGIRVVTIAAQEDAIVTPEDALLPAAGSEPSAIILNPPRRPGAPYAESILGHGALLNDPVFWRRVLAALGPAE